MSEQLPTTPVGLPRRLLLGALMAASGAFAAFVAGAALGAKFLVSPGAGLAGPAEVVGYGLLAAAAAVLLAMLVAAFAKRGLLLLATAASVVLALAAAGVMAFLVQRSPTPGPASEEVSAPPRTATQPDRL